MKVINFIILILCFSVLSADYAGGYSGSVLRLGVSARDLSLSGSMVSAYNEGFSAFSNPSFVSKTKGLAFGSSLFLLGNNTSMQAFSISRDLPPNAGASLSVVHLGVSDIIGINSNEQFTNYLGYHDSYAMLSFGINFSEYISIGINTKTLFQRYNLSNSEILSSDGISFDIGFLSSPIENLNIGIKINNLLGHYKWENSRIEIPTQFISGISYSPKESLLLLFQHELIDINQKYLSHRSSFGTEFKINMTNSNAYIIRFGLKQNQWAIINNESVSDLFKVTSGLGIKFKSFNKSIINLDYAIMFNNELGVSNLISISAEL